MKYYITDVVITYITVEAENEEEAQQKYLCDKKGINYEEISNDSKLFVSDKYNELRF